MKQIVLIEFDVSRWSLWKSPEQVTFFGLCIQWISVNELTNCMVEKFLKLQSSVFNTLTKALGSLIEHLDTFLERLNVFRRDWINTFTFFNNFLEILRLRVVQSSEFLTSPLNTMNSFLREHFQSTHRDLIIILWVFL